MKETLTTIRIQQEAAKEATIDNVKDLLKGNIESLPDETYADLQYLYRLYRLTKAKLIENAAHTDQSTSCI